jgi:hypothetical protein
MSGSPCTRAYKEQEPAPPMVNLAASSSARAEWQELTTIAIFQVPPMAVNASRIPYLE